MKKIVAVGLFLFTANLLCAQEIAIEKVKKDIAYLSSDKLKGRRTGTKYEKMASDYIIRQFKNLQLDPKGNDGFLYAFSFKHNPNPHDTATIHLKSETGHDVIAFLDNKAEKIIVIGAHYDHLGLGYDHNSLDPKPEGKIHNGADDNASGTAGVLALADYFVNNGVTEKYNFLFMCFSGEELGLIGSKKWCDNPTIPLTSINFMINMDMIGRLNDTTKKLLVYGVGTSPIWVPLLAAENDYFSIKNDSAGIGPSDQTSFYLKDIPVLHFFTGQHSDYHKPSDDAEKINYNGEAKILSFIAKLINKLDTEPPLIFQKTKAPDTGKSAFKVTLGIMPDYTFEGKGVRIDGVTDGKPAANAGLQKGDIIIELGENPILSMQDYMKALGKFEKGKKTTVKILRGEKTFEKEVTF